MKLWILLTIACVALPAQAVGSGNDLLPDVPTGSLVIELENVVSIAPANLVDITHAGDGSERLFLVSPDGVIRVYKNDAVLPTPFLNTPAYPPDQAMTGLAFHPEFATNGKLYVITGETTAVPPTAHYDSPQGDASSAFDNILIEYQVDSGNPDVVDLASRRELLRIHQPHKFHSMGDLTFGADGYLYVAMGDGGDTRTGTPTHYNTTEQQTTNPYGAILRIDVDTLGTNGRYEIPSDNPFADGAGGNAPEIYAWGLRNPWRITTDRLTGDIYTGVNGDFTIEQVYRVENGRNYGWDEREGSFLWDSVTGNASVDPSPDPSLTAPLAEYDHNGTVQGFGSVIGGFVYRGSRIPALYGKYLFNDFVAAAFVVMDTQTGALERVQIDPAGVQPSQSKHANWAEDENGELYLGNYDGQVLRLVPTQAADLAGRVPNGADAPGTPLTIDKQSGGGIELSWGASCLPGDDDYAVYEGTLGQFDGHQPETCSTAGAVTWTLTPLPGDAFYLVVPIHGLREGSYGLDSDGNPRATGEVRCLLQAVAECS